MKLCQTKVEEWLESALTDAMEPLDVDIFTASAKDDPPHRPCLFISATTMVPTADNLWQDNERTVEVTLSLESSASDSLSNHINACIELESALSDVASVVALASGVADFYAYDYQITRTEKGNASEVRFFEIILSARVRDDDGTGV